jgi:circadian clock protein KaiB
MTNVRTRRAHPAKRAGKIHLKIYVASMSPNSLRALENLRRIMERADAPPRLDIIDVLTCAAAALDANIVISPTLVRVSPLPMVRIVGDLSDADAVIDALDLVRKAPSP